MTGLSQFDPAEVARHEAAHAIAAHALGWDITSISARSSDGITRYTRACRLSSQAIKVALAGPIATEKYLRLDEGSDDDLLFLLHDETRWENGRTMTDLRRERKMFDLETWDNYSVAFHFDRRLGAIPTDKTIMKYYRTFENSVRVFVDSKWEQIRALAAEIIAKENFTMTGAKFAAFMKQ
jgi:hypothetical protein